MAAIEIEKIKAAVKTVLKNRKCSYAKLAAGLGVSEQTVKRFFTSGDISMNRLLQICEYLGMTLSEIMELVSSTPERVFRLTLDQEEELCRQPHLLAFYELLLEGSTPLEIKEQFLLRKKQVKSILKELEALQLIERLPADRIKLVHSGTMNWIIGGPLQEKFLVGVHMKLLKKVPKKMQRYMDSKEEFYTSSHRRVSKPVLMEMCKRLDELYKDFRKIAQTEENLRNKTELVSVAWLSYLLPAANPVLQELENFVERSKVV